MNKFDIALKQMPVEDGITKSDIIELLDIMKSEEVLPLDIDGENACAVGFLTIETADAINFNYHELIEFIRNILNDVDNESEDESYEFKTSNGETFTLHLGYARI